MAPDQKYARGEKGERQFPQFRAERFFSDWVHPENPSGFSVCPLNKTSLAVFPSSRPPVTQKTPPRGFFEKTKDCNRVRDLFRESGNMWDLENQWQEGVENGGNFLGPGNPLSCASPFGNQNIRWNQALGDLYLASSLTGYFFIC